MKTQLLSLFLVIALAGSPIDQQCDSMEIEPMVGFFPWRAAGDWHVQWKVYNFENSDVFCEQYRFENDENDLFVTNSYIQLFSEFFNIVASPDGTEYSQIRWNKNNWGEGFNFYPLNPPEQVRLVILDTDYDNWLMFYYCNDAPRSLAPFDVLSYHVITRTPDGSMPKEAAKMLKDAEERHTSHISKKSYYYSYNDDCEFNLDLI